MNTATLTRPAPRDSRSLRDQVAALPASTLDLLSGLTGYNLTPPEPEDTTGLADYHQTLHTARADAPTEQVPELDAEIAWVASTLRAAAGSADATADPHGVLARTLAPGLTDWLTHAARPAAAPAPSACTAPPPPSTPHRPHRGCVRHRDPARRRPLQSLRQPPRLVCPACAGTYRRDAYQLLARRPRGGKGIPDTVVPAPGRVRHLHRTVLRHRPHPHRRASTTCTNRQPLRLPPRTLPRPPRPPGSAPTAARCLLGPPRPPPTPVSVSRCAWTATTTTTKSSGTSTPAELWHRTKQAIERHLPARPHAASPASSHTTGIVRCRRSGSPRQSRRIQRRGVVHFHALFRLDGIDPDDPTAITAPPPGLTADRPHRRSSPHAAATTGFTTPGAPRPARGWPITWGDQATAATPTSASSARACPTRAHRTPRRRLPRQIRHQKHRSHRPLLPPASPQRRIALLRRPRGDHIGRLIDACWTPRPTRTHIRRTGRRPASRSRLNGTPLPRLELPATRRRYPTAACHTYAPPPPARLRTREDPAAEQPLCTASPLGTHARLRRPLPHQIPRLLHHLRRDSEPHAAPGHTPPLTAATNAHRARPGRPPRRRRHRHHPHRRRTGTTPAPAGSPTATPSSPTRRQQRPRTPTPPPAPPRSLTTQQRTSMALQKPSNRSKQMSSLAPERLFPAPPRSEYRVIQPKWHTVAEAAVLLNFGLTKTKMLVITGELRSCKDGKHRRILPEWIDEYIARRASEWAS